MEGIFGDQKEWVVATLEQGEHSNKVAELKDEITFLTSKLEIRRGLLDGTGVDEQKILSEMHEIDIQIKQKNQELADEIINQEKRR